MAITHAKVATIADEAGAEVNKTEWNDDHTIGVGTDFLALGITTFTESALGSLGASETIDISTANFFSATLDDDTSITFSNPASTGIFQKFIIHFTQDAGGGNTPTFVDTVTGSPAFDTGSNAVTTVVFYTFDGGTTYFAFNSDSAGDMVLTDVQTITGAKTFNTGKLVLAGSTSGTSTLNPTAVAGTTTLTLPAVTDTLAVKGANIFTANQDLGGNDIDNGGVIFLTEQAEADSDVAGKGQIWVDTQTPNKLFFTDDVGTDFEIGGGSLANIVEDTSPQLGGTLDCQTNNLTNMGTLSMGDRTVLTIASGVVTATTSYHQIDTESAGSSDDLDTINGGTIGDILIITATSSSRTIVIKDATGNIQLNGDFSLTHTQDTAGFIYNGTNWLEIMRSNNGA